MHIDAVYKINMVTLAFGILTHTCINMLEKHNTTNSSNPKRIVRSALFFIHLQVKVSFNRNSIQIASNNVNNKFNKLLSARKIENNLITPALCGLTGAYFLCGFCRRISNGMMFYTMEEWRKMTMMQKLLS